ncbi:UreF-domain-containing protein [Syncephalis pseudoplumigaleata]|uniref:UreF-domain-containing protein n=1 Tax=Syncephalis pseudoplumigaleata TaxID=1712513 RepID=A0A4P9YZ19_9FUNG|nr:UreF-domain-containing protein [Syncephalis pseudoplumigaleata]|eukprot:RKP25238.1 UreF-domain-containing protein [Syncephalis pseudoplumigaleata]
MSTAIDTSWAVEWLVYQLTDSLLPTGGFVCSSGLEAAAQHGWVRDESSLMHWCEASLTACARASLPFLDEAYRLAHGHRPSATATAAAARHHYTWCSGDWWDPIDTAMSSSTSSTSAGIWRELVALDDRCDACITTNVARKSSQSQGRALITAYVRCFADNPPSDPANGRVATQHAEQLAHGFLQGIRRGHVVGHLPISFGLSCAALGLELERTRHLFLFLYARNLFSSAVRLNLVGPYRAQRLLQQLSARATEAMQQHVAQMQAYEAAGESPIAATAQIAPLLDLFQGAHDRLYSRLFHS